MHRSSFVYIHVQAQKHDESEREKGKRCEQQRGHIEHRNVGHEMHSVSFSLQASVLYFSNDCTLEEKALTTNKSMKEEHTTRYAHDALVNQQWNADAR